MIEKEERVQILESLDKGDISAEEAANRLTGAASESVKRIENPIEVLEALEIGSISTDEAAEKLAKVSVERAMPHIMDDSTRISQTNISKAAIPIGIWTVPLWIGIVLIATSAWWMANRLSGPGLDFWFFSAWLPLAFGVLLVLFAWASRNSPRIHVRIRSKSEGDAFKINFGLPIPLGIFRWGVHRFGPRYAELPLDQIDMLMDDLEIGKFKREPIVVHIEDDDDNVEIVIG